MESGSPSPDSYQGIYTQAYVSREPTDPPVGGPWNAQPFPRTLPYNGNPEAKPMLEKETPVVRPEVLELFGHDLDDVEDFLDCCDEHERGIIDSTPDKKVLIQIVKRIQDDVDETSKDLAMDG
jgi:hypothetical protein